MKQANIRKVENSAAMQAVSGGQDGYGTDGEGDVSVTPMAQVVGGAADVGAAKPKSAFRRSYRNSSRCSRLTYRYTSVLIDSVKANSNTMTEDMIEDMCLRDGETDMYTQRLLKNIELQQKKYEQAKPNRLNNYYAFRDALWVTFRGDILSVALLYTVSECLSVGFTSFLIYLIKYLRDPDASLREGIIYLVLLSCMIVSSILLKNLAYFHGFNWTITMRKAMISSLYSKVAKLSMKSLTETNSGKLITIIS